MAKKSKTFKEVVQATPDIKTCYQEGLQALGKHSKKIILGETRKCEGSVFIDECATPKDHQGNRWDYVFAYKSYAYFVEVHSAYTNEVTTVLRKLQWLKDWLNQRAPELNKIKAKEHPFYWIQSNNFAIPRHLPEYRRIAQAGLRPIKKLVLP
jgi:hypothetical protein